jgi:LacI family transcriptional regulator, galactose operon repressor
MRGKIKLQEIAVAAKVSVATASRALNGTGQVSQEVKKRVLAAIAKLGSAPQHAGRADAICFLLANRSRLHPFHANVLMGAQEFSAEHQTQVLFYPFRYSAEAALDDIHLPLLFDRRGNVGGYIVGGMNSENLLQLLARTGTPFAVLGNNVLSPWNPGQYDVVWMDDLGGSRELTQHLLQLGHTAIWFVGSRRFPTERIFQGYAEVMEEAGLSPQAIVNDSEDEHDIGYLAAKSLFARGVPVTAIFCYNDAVSHGAYEAVRSRGLRIPDDVTVVGFGDRPEAKVLSPPLTSVWAYPDQVGRRLAELVLNRLKNPGLPPQEIILPTRLMERSSCGPVANGILVRKRT